MSSDVETPPHGHLPYALRALLVPGEVVLWHGRSEAPAGGPSMRMPLTGLVLAMLSVALLIAYVVWAGAEVDGRIAVIGMAALGVAAFLGFRDVLSGKPEPWRWDTLYAVTDRRVVIVPQRSRPEGECYPAGLIAQLERRNHLDGRTDVIFRRDWLPRDPRSIPVGFFGIRDADGAEAALRHLRASVVPRANPWNPPPPDTRPTGAPAP